MIPRHFMFGLRKRRKEKARQQTVNYLASVEGALLGRVLFIVEREHGTEDSEALSRSVVHVLLARPGNGNVAQHALAKELAGAIVGDDKQIRDSLFVSLRAMLAIAGDTNNFAGERRILETLFWLKQFGDMPPHSHEPDLLIGLAAQLKVSPVLPEMLTNHAELTIA